MVMHLDVDASLYINNLECRSNTETKNIKIK